MGKKKKRRIPVKTGRVVHHFWLNIWNTSEGRLDNEVQELKKQRKFAETVRDGLRLILDLRAGSLEVLFELFPHLQERLAGQTTSPTPQPPPTPDPTELAKEIAAQIILQGGTGGYMMQSTGQQPDTNRTGQGSKQLTPKQFELPKFEDDDDETQPSIAVTKNTSTSATSNFIAAAMALQ